MCEIDRRTFVMRTREDKTTSRAWSLLTARALGIIKHLRRDAPGDEFIFDPERAGRKRRQLMICFGRAVKEAEISSCRFHDLRHTFATRLLATNAREYDIDDLSGHSTTPGDTRNARVTRGHAHAVPQRLRGGVDGMEE